MSAGRGPSGSSGTAGQERPRPSEDVVWHDVENGSYAADLQLWERLAREHPGGVVDLGAGTGRVALHLAGSGHRVTAVDNDQALLAELGDRARDRGLAIETVCCDVRSLELPGTYPLILAPMQLLHILRGEAGRRRTLGGVAAHLRPGGRFCAAVLDEPLPFGAARPDPIPDVRELDGWVYSSLPTEIHVGEGSIRLRRLRQLVAPGGGLTDEPSSITLDRFSLAALDRDAAAAGLQIVSGERIPSTVRYEDSVVVSMEAVRV